MARGTQPPQPVVQLSSRGPSRGRRFDVTAKRLARLLVVVAVTVALAAHSHTLRDATRHLGRLSPGWLGLAVLAEGVSLVMSAELQRHLLASAGARLGRRFLVAVAYASGAVSALLPAGAALSASYSYRRLTGRGASRTLTAWVLVASGVVSIVALLFLGLVGAQVRGLLCSALGRLAGGAITTAGIGALALLAWTSRGSRLETISASVERGLDRADALLRLGRRRTVDQRLVLLSADGDEIAMGTTAWLGAVFLAAGNWLVDCAALALAFLALGVAVPWPGLLLAYVVSQIVVALPVLGCIGVAEGSVTLVLTCLGVAPDRALAVAVLYRLVTFWSVLPMGWLAWAHLRRQEGRVGLGSPASRDSLRAA